MAAMEPVQTSVLRPIQLQIADDIRMKIERGEYRPGDTLPTLHELMAEWQCSMTSARNAVSLLKQQGLISGGRGTAPIVRKLARRVVRDAARHQMEKDLALEPEDVRRSHGEAEDDLGDSLRDLKFSSEYSTVQADPEFASIFDCAPGDPLLRKEYETSDPSGTRLTYSVAHVPVRLIESNPVLLDESCEPWPGGAQHQFRTVGIEIAQVVDEVTAGMPTTVDVQRWGLDDGVPMLLVRRISTDTNGRVVEVSDAEYPADRTELRFTTPLKLWSE
jgi:GntR family transcriptional regulator